MSLAIQNVSVHLEERGTGAPIVFLHGVPDSSDMWNGIIERLEGKYRCLAPDLPGLGRSVAPDNFICSLEHMASFIDELVESISPDTPVRLVVTDFGATYGLAWAVTHPEKVQRLAIVGGANFFTDYRWHSNARMLRLPVLGELGMATVTRASFAKTMGPNAPKLGIEHFRRIYDLSMARPSVRRMVLRLYRALDSKNFAGWQERLIALTAKVPTCVLWGDADPFISSDYAERFGSAQVEHFPENGHWLAIEEPELIAQRLAAFFAE